MVISSLEKSNKLRYFITIAGSPACAGRSNGRTIMWFVYILKSSNCRWYYVGSTNDLNRRLSEHNLGKVSSTKARKPFTVVFTKELISEKEARAYEKMIKDKRTEKEKIIREIEK